MTRPATVQLGADRLRVGPWRGDPRVAYLAPTIGRPPAAATVTECIGLLRAQGYRQILTSALTLSERNPFEEAGFGEHERLHLLRHALSDLPSRSPHRLRRGRGRDRRGVLAVDSAAFDPFWRFDSRGLDEARTATPTARFRVAGPRRHVVGYAISGRAGSVSYLQRLAVHPDAQGSGLGFSLVVDALHWAHRRGAEAMLVNTQEHNQRALDLYERVGFELQANGLVVLALDMATTSDATGLHHP